MSWTYEVPTGRLYDPTGSMLAVGYSGAPGAVNDSSKQNIPNVGPIPCGLWNIGEMYDDAETGPHTLPLTPATGTDTFDRSEFKMHGDDIRYPGQQKASKGCIVEPLFARERVNESTDKQLNVVLSFTPPTAS